jgi:hypothetical protein
MIATQFLGTALMVALLASAAGAEGFSVRCPTEGLFTGEPEIFHTMPNPSAGWDFYFDEGSTRNVELSPPPKRDGFWLITCQIETADGLISITSHISGTRACHISPNGGSIKSLQDGGQSCLLGKSNGNDTDDRCTINCE